MRVSTCSVRATREVRFIYPARPSIFPPRTIYPRPGRSFRGHLLRERAARKVIHAFVPRPPIPLVGGSRRKWRFLLRIFVLVRVVFSPPKGPRVSPRDASSPRWPWNVLEDSCHPSSPANLNGKLAE